MGFLPAAFLGSGSRFDPWRDEERPTPIVPRLCRGASKPSGSGGTLGTPGDARKWLNCGKPLTTRLDPSD